MSDHLISCKCGAEHFGNIEDDHWLTCPDCHQWGCYEDLGIACPECGEPRPDDDRVKNGMKCGQCAYGGE